MNASAPADPIDPTGEISALIETLHAAEERLAVLTAGQVDSVSNRVGRTFLLKGAQERLRNSEAIKQAAILEAMPAHVALVNVRGTIVSVNEAWCRFARDNILQGPGYGVGVNYLDLCDKAVGTDAALAHGVAEGMRAVLSGELNTYTVEYACHSPTEERWFQLTLSPLADKPPSGAVVMHTDITSRSQALQSMQRSADLLSMSGRLAKVGSWYFDLPPRQVVWSAMLATIHEEQDGFSPTVEEAIGYYTPEHRPVLRLAMKECIEHGTAFDLEHEIVTAKGTRIWVRAIGHAVRNSEGKIHRIEGALQDLSQLKQAEREAGLLAYRLTNTLESITDGFLTLDRDWRYTFVNNEALRMFGRRREDLIGRNMWEEFPEALDTEFERGYRHAMTADGGTNFEAFYVPWDRWIAVHCYPSEIGLSIYFRDVTERRRDQDALRELNADLEARVAQRTAELNLAREGAEQANRAKSSFLAAMSHEIRTPMNGVVGMIDVLEQSNLKSAQADIVKTVRESAYALLRIVDDVLDFSKIEAGHFQIDHDPMSIERTIERVRDTLDHLATSKGVALRMSLDPAIPARVLGDEARLRQVLLNLVGNAIKFSAAESLAGRVDVRAQRVESNTKDAAEMASVEFTIGDNGIGMDEATLARLFTPFTQADDSTTKRFGGTGLGLSISSRLAGLMGGTIEVTSEPGLGSQFTLRLPFEVLQVEPEMAENDHDRFRDDTGNGDIDTMPMPLGAIGASQVGRLILVAEDNEINQKVIRKQLALLGFTTDIAANGREALDRSRHGNYSMLLTDLHMPVMDGYQLTAAIRKDEASGPRMPVIALTANALKGEARRCKEVGMDDYMTKPVQLTDLHAMLLKWMPASARPTPLRKPRPSDGRLQAKPDDTEPGSLHPSTPPADLGILAALVGNDPNVIGELLEAFLKSAARSGDAIRKGVAAGRTKGVADAAHTLKSGARSIGAKRLGSLCEDMEHAADAGRTTELVSQLARFEIELGSLLRFLDARVVDGRQFDANPA